MAIIIFYSVLLGIVIGFSIIATIEKKWDRLTVFEVIAALMMITGFLGSSVCEFLEKHKVGTDNLVLEVNELPQVDTLINYSRTNSEQPQIDTTYTLTFKHNQKKQELHQQ